MLNGTPPEPGRVSVDLPSEFHESKHNPDITESPTEIDLSLLLA